MRSVSAPGLSYRLGRGVVALRLDGSVEAVRPGPNEASYLVGGGRVKVLLGGTDVSWPDPTVAADVDEVEFGFTEAEGLGLVVRHSFAADWGVRVALVNHTLEPLSLTAELAWAPAPESPAWALAAGVTGVYAIPGPDGTGPLLGGELVLGTCVGASERGIGLGRVELGPLERWVVQWRWAWYANPRTFSRNRFATVPRDLVLPDTETARILADDDAAVVAPGVDTARRGPHLELSSPGPQRVGVEVRSHRGVTAYDLEWVGSLDDVLAQLADGLLEGRRSRAGVPVLGDVDAALAVQHLLARGWLSTPDQADDALGLFTARAADSDPVDGRGVGLLCGEFERTGDPDLLDYATKHLLELDRPVPGLGLAAAQVCVARLTQDWPLDPVLTHVGRVAEGTTGDALDHVAADLELRLTTAPRGAGDDPGCAGGSSPGSPSRGGAGRWAPRPTGAAAGRRSAGVPRGRTRAPAGGARRAVPAGLGRTST